MEITWRSQVPASTSPVCSRIFLSSLRVRLHPHPSFTHHLDLTEACTHMNIDTHTCTHTCTYTHLYVHTHVHACAYTHTYACAHTYTKYMHLYTHTHTRTPMDLECRLSRSMPTNTTISRRKCFICLILKGWKATNSILRGDANALHVNSRCFLPVPVRSAHTNDGDICAPGGDAATRQGPLA